eukprot:5549115-Ditylum_brightwellii.AAC.1
MTLSCVLLAHSEEMYALVFTEGVPVLISIFLAGDAILVKPACCVAVFLDDVVPFCAERGRKYLLIEVECPCNQHVHLLVQGHAQVLELLDTC